MAALCVALEARPVACLRVTAGEPEGRWHVSTAEYAAGRADYGSRIEARTRRVDALKAALGKELEPSEREADMCRLKPESTAVQREGGELSAATFDSERQRWASQSRRCGERVEILDAALAAESAADLEGLTVHAEAEATCIAHARAATTVPLGTGAPLFASARSIVP